MGKIVLIQLRGIFPSYFWSNEKPLTKTQMPLINLSDAINLLIEIVLPYEHENHDIYPVMNCIKILASSVNMTVTNETLSFARKQF